MNYDQYSGGQIYTAILDLTELQTLFEDPNNHTQEAFARDDCGEECDSKSAHAVCWCMLGGLDYVCGYERSPGLPRDVLTEIARSVVPRCSNPLNPAVFVNDKKGLREVRQLIQAGIDSLQAERDGRSCHEHPL